MTGTLPALLAAGIFVLGWVLERALLIYRLPLYFALSLPLRVVLSPIPEAPAVEGQCGAVHWERAGQVVRFWADGRKRTVPGGLHGQVRLAQGPKGVNLAFRWAPPLTPLLAACWLAGLGVTRGELFTLPVALGMVAAIGLLYRQAAVRVAAELRAEWARGS